MDVWFSFVRSDSYHPQVHVCISKLNRSHSVITLKCMGVWYGLSGLTVHLTRMILSSGKTMLRQLDF